MLINFNASSPSYFIDQLPNLLGKPCIYGSIRFEAIMRTTTAISALKLTDLNTNGLFDILVATAQGVRVYIAEDYMDYVTGQWLDTGDTTAMVLHDFNGNGLSDLITINRFGTIQFFKNMAGTGLVEVGSPIQAHGAGPLKVLDVLHNHQRDLIVEVAPGIEQVIDVGDIFGPQPIITSGKRVIRYAFFDHLGSTRMLTDDLGDVVWPSMGGEPNRLSPFGKDVAYSDGDIVRESYLLNFTNKEIDYNLDLHYFGARYYTADFPRFISPDPVSGKPMNPLTWNRYLYCANDPINYIDPDGNDREFWRFMLKNNDAMQWATALGSIIGGVCLTSTGKMSILGLPMIYGGGAFMVVSYTNTRFAFNQGREIVTNAIATKLAQVDIMYRQDLSSDQKWELISDQNLISPDEWDRMERFGVTQADIEAAIQEKLNAYETTDVNASEE
jgi:RHS repeat-associated protein